MTEYSLTVSSFYAKFSMVVISKVHMSQLKKKDVSFITEENVCFNTTLKL